MAEPNDDALMSAYAAGDASAFEQLYARHQAGLYRFVRRLLGPSLAAQTDEVFQDTWLRVVHARASWQPQGASFRTWLFTLANNRVIDIWRLVSSIGTRFHEKARRPMADSDALVRFMQHHRDRLAVEPIVAARL